MKDPLIGELVEVPAGSSERQVVEAGFQQTLRGRGITIVSVQRVQNQQQWDE